MISQRIRIRTDIFQSQEFTLLEERAEDVSLNLILPTPVPSIRNDFFKPYDEPDVICLGNVKDCDYNDNRSSKDLPYPTIKEFQGQFSEDKQSLEGEKINFESETKELVDQINESLKIELEILKKQLYKKGIYFVNGIYSCSVCQIGLKKGDINSHLQGKRHTKLVDIKVKAIRPKSLKRKLKLVAKNEISSREFIKIKELKDGKKRCVCLLCDVVIKSEYISKYHLKDHIHKATYERFSK